MLSEFIDSNAPVHHARYRFRYQCDIDLARLILLVREQPSPPLHVRFLEVKRDEVLIETDMTLNAVQRLLYSVEDGHVMAETAHFAVRYTGKRTPNCHDASQPECDD